MHCGFSQLLCLVCLGCDTKFWLNSPPLFLLQGCQFKELFKSQYLCIQGLRVKIVNFAFIKSCTFKKSIFLQFLNVGQFHQKKWSYWSKAKLISLYMVYLFNFTFILWRIDRTLWTSIKVSCRLDKNLNIFFFIYLFFSKIKK